MNMLSEKTNKIIVDASSTIIQTMKLMDDRRTKSLLVFTEKLVLVKYQ